MLVLGKVEQLIVEKGKTEQLKVMPFQRKQGKMGKKDPKKNK